MAHRAGLDCLQCRQDRATMTSTRRSANVFALIQTASKSWTTISPTCCVKRRRPSAFEWLPTPIDTARLLAAAGIRYQHPDWTEEQVQARGCQENAAMEQIEFLKFARRCAGATRHPLRRRWFVRQQRLGRIAYDARHRYRCRTSGRSGRRRCARPFPSRTFTSAAAAANEAVQRHGQFNVIHPASGNKIDFMIAGQRRLGNGST